MAALFSCSIFINMNIEIPWNAFRQLPENNKLSLNEQQLRYYNYIQSLERERIDSIIQTINTVPVAGNNLSRDLEFLLQEDGAYLLQENGFKIKLT